MPRTATIRTMTAIVLMLKSYPARAGRTKARTDRRTRPAVTRSAVLTLAQFGPGSSSLPTAALSARLRLTARFDSNTGLKDAHTVRDATTAPTVGDRPARRQLAPVSRGSVLAGWPTPFNTAQSRSSVCSPPACCSSA
jgi:hypothetical protein